jgi:hypothetical protein
MFNQSSKHMFVQGLSDLRGLSVHNIKSISAVEKGKTSGARKLTVQTVRKFCIDSGVSAARGELSALAEIPISVGGELLFDRQINLSQEYFHLPASAWDTSDWSWI